MRLVSIADAVLALIGTGTLNNAPVFYRIQVTDGGNGGKPTSTASCSALATTRANSRCAAATSPSAASYSRVDHALSES